MSIILSFYPFTNIIHSSFNTDGSCAPGNNCVAAQDTFAGIIN